MVMPTIKENKWGWDEHHKWPQRGDEWSESWGGHEAQWYGTIYPRIHAFLPAGTILEIAPGFGRWTRYLKDQCRMLVAVDLADKCVAACKERFAAYPQVVVYQNDGLSLDMVQDGSVDFVFSFDSLVHVEADVIASYLWQIKKKLTPDGVGFIHHSNLAECPPNLPAEKVHWRGMMAAAIFEQHCVSAGMRCIVQEKVNWTGGAMLLDCFSTFTLMDSKWDRGNLVIDNDRLMLEADMVRELSRAYHCYRKD
jgi:SAM-dependent methyltransferase